jgi:hypothetical protein
MLHDVRSCTSCLAKLTTRTLVSLRDDRSSQRGAVVVTPREAEIVCCQLLSTFKVDDPRIDCGVL